MARIAFLLATEFEDSEFRTPYERLRDAGHDLTIVGEKMGVLLKGKSKQHEALTEKALSEARAEDFDGLVIPGGYSPDKLRVVDGVSRFVREFAAQNKFIAAICHAGSLLVDADLVRGKTVTSWPSIRTDLENAGALWKDQALVVDGNLITSRKPEDLDLFCEAILDRISATRLAAVEESSTAR